jgi:hypothetical protein
MPVIAARNLLLLYATLRAMLRRPHRLPATQPADGESGQALRQADSDSAPIATR